MSYEDLSIDEANAFHDAVIAKHQACKAHIAYKATALSDDEKTLRDSAIAVIMARAVQAIDFKKVSEEETPTVEETAAALDGQPQQ